jgi:hypothetical protein
MGCPDPSEHGGGLAAGSSPTEPAGECIAHIGGQGKSFLAAPLAPNDDLAGTPVEVSELQCRHLPGAQPETSQHGEHRVVPPAEGGSPVTARQQSGHLGAADGHRNRGEAPTRRCGHRRVEFGLDAAGDIEVAKQRPQPAHDVLGRAHRTRRALRQHELGHLRRSEPIEMQLAVHRACHAEQPRHMEVPGNGARRQAPLLDQIGPVVLLKPLGLADRNMLRWGRDRAEAAQELKHGHHRLGRPPQHVALGLSVREELLHPPRHQVIDIKPLALEPAAGMRHQLQLAARCIGRVAQPFEFSTEPRRVGHERSGQPDP